MRAGWIPKCKQQCPQHSVSSDDSHPGTGEHPGSLPGSVSQSSLASYLERFPMSLLRIFPAHSRSVLSITHPPTHTPCTLSCTFCPTQALLTVPFVVFSPLIISRSLSCLLDEKPCRPSNHTTFFLPQQTPRACCLYLLRAFNLVKIWI